MLPGDRLICAFTKIFETGYEFKAWPLHVTVVPWFRLEASTEEIAADLADGLRVIEPFEVRMDGIEFFGRHKNKRVNVVVEPTPLSGIEAEVRDYLHSRQAWLVDETTRRRLPFRPHVTAQGTSHLSKGNTFGCDRLYIIEQLGKSKAVVGSVGLAGSVESGVSGFLPENG